jgi:CubicO group peptidase (beta-lactamase class C family)
VNYDLAKFVAYHGKTSSEHQAQFSSLSSQGFRIISLCVYAGEDNPRYAAVWVQRGGPAWLAFHGKNGDQYQDFFKTHTANGFRPVIITATGSGSDIVYAGVFEKDTTPFIAKHGISEAQFVQQCDWAQKNNYILRWASVYGAANNTYAGIWEKNTNNVGWNYSLGDDSASYLNKFNAYTSGWVRPALVAVSANHRYLAVWYDNSIGNWIAHHGMTSQTYQAKFNELTSQGFSPIRVQAGGEGSNVRFAAIFAKDDNVIARQWTVTGTAVPALSGFDDYVKKLMQKTNVRAGSLAIVKDHKLVFAHAYTWGEPGYPITQPTSLFRIASTSKPLTSIAIHQLIEKNKLSLADKVQTILQLQPQCGGTQDSRLQNVQVSHTLYHTGGWNTSGLGFDPLFHDEEIANACGGQLPVTKSQIASYTTGKPMQFDPGTKTIYSNYGFSLLGRIVSSSNYINAVKDSVFKPLGITRARLGRSLVKDKTPDEVRYHPVTPGVKASVITPDRPLVPGVYGGWWNQENLDSVGGWVMATVDYAKVLASFDMGYSNPILKPSTVTTMWTAHPTWTGVLRGWFKQILTDSSGKLVDSVQHNGWLASNSNLILRRADKLSFVLFLNQGYPGMLHAATHGVALNDIANKVTQWPTTDLFPTVGIPAFQ